MPSLESVAESVEIFDQFIDQLYSGKGKVGIRVL